MKEFKWDAAKNEWLKITRGMSFEEIVGSKLITTKDHPRIPHQKIMYF